MESTKEVLVRRSNNLFLPFSNDARYAIGKDIAFSSDPTLFATIMNDGNIHIHGTKSAGDSGYVLLWSLTQRLVLKAGSTYNFSISATAHTQFILQSDQSGTRTNIMQVNPAFTNGLTKTMTEDTVITHVFMNISGATPINIGDTVDEYVNPMLVEQSARMDYEPYYHEYESTKEVLVRRSNNLIPYFPDKDARKLDGQTTSDISWEIKDNNIRIFGTTYNGVINGYIIFELPTSIKFKAGHTYTMSANEFTKGKMNVIIQGRDSTGTRFTAIYANQTKTFTDDTEGILLFFNCYVSDLPETIDLTLDEMLVEGDTKQDYEPYYYEAEASKTEIIPDDGSLTSVVDFSNAVKGKRLNPHDGVTLQTNNAYAYVPDYFPCETGDVFKFTYVGQEKIKDQNYRQNQIMWYDVNKNFLSFEAKDAWSPITFSAAPANAKFFRINYSGLYLAKIEWMLPSNPKLTKVTS